MTSSKIDQFKSIVEIQSIDNLIHGCMEEIKKSQGRVDFVKESFSSTQEEFDELSLKESNLKSESLKEENLLEEITNRLTSMDAKKNTITTQSQLDAFKNQEKELGAKQEIGENKVLELLEELEEVSREIKEKESFLAGGGKTISELESEVNTIITQKNNEISQYQKRVDLLIESLNEKFHLVFTQSHKLLRFNNPLSSLNKEHCAKCFFTIDKVKQHSVEHDYNIEQCTSCKRILVPFAARN